MMTSVLNPFALTFRPSPAAPDDDKLEHLASVRDLEAHLSVRAMDLKQYLERVRALAAVPSNSQATQNALTHKARTLEQDIVTLERACKEVYNCDPWSYEPSLLDELISLHEGGAPQADIDRIRGLIRAGSWMQYQRMNEAEIVDDIRRLRRRETQADAELAAVERAFTARLVGPALESAVRTVEYLSLRNWLMLKQAQAMGSSSLAESSSHTALRTELADLRALRDMLYFRRLYPNIAKKGFAT